MATKKYLGPAGLSELVTLLKNDLSGKQRVFQYMELPDPSKSTGRVVQYVGPSGKQFKKGLFYYSTGLAWEEIAGASLAVGGSLPAWEEADDKTIYFVLQSDKKTVKMFLKSDKQGMYYEVGAENYNTLQNTPLINGMSTQNVTEPDKPAAVELRVKVQQYPDSDNYDKNAPYPTNPDDVRVNKLSMKAFTDNEIFKAYEEA